MVDKLIIISSYKSKLYMLKIEICYFLYAIDNQIEKLNSLHLLNVIDSTS